MASYGASFERTRPVGLPIVVVTYKVDASRDWTASSDALLTDGSATVESVVTSIHACIRGADVNALAVVAEVMLLLDASQGVNSPGIQTRHLAVRVSNVADVIGMLGFENL